MTEAKRFTERFGPNHSDGYQYFDELVQGLGRILRDIHSSIPNQQAAGRADALVGIITTIYSSLAWRASDLESVLLALRNHEDANDPINARIEQAFADHFTYDKSEFRRDLLTRLIQEEQE